MPNNKNSIYKKYKTASECMRSFIDEPIFIHEYGTDNYSNIGYIILGHIIEKITDLSFINAYKKYIFVPLKMFNTDFDDQITLTRLYGENCSPITKKENKFRYWGSSAGGLYSCVNDLLIFANKSLSLLNHQTLKMLQNDIYIGKMNSDRGNIGHSGKIYGSHARFYFTNNNNILEKIYIEFITCISIDKEINEYYDLLKR